MALVGIILILLANFGMVRLTALVFLTLPFALVGAIAAAFLTGGVLSLGSFDKAGHEIEHPMAAVILGGLVTSTVLNLFLLPPLFLGFGHQEHMTDTQVS